MSPVSRRDSRGRLLAVGQRVAYNRSGNVAEGKIIDIQWSHIKIEPHPDYVRNCQRGLPYSRVKNSLSIMVLDD
jgi:hypothetical protein